MSFILNPYRYAPPPGGSAPSVIGHNGMASAATSSGSWSVPMPTETIPNGSRLVLFTWHAVGSGTLTATGWTQIEQHYTSGGNLTILERVSDGTEGANVTVTHSVPTNGKHGGIIVALSASTLDIDGADTTFAAATSSTCTAPSVNTSGTNRRVLCCFMGQAGSAPTVNSVNGPDASHLRTSAGTGASSVCGAVATFTKATAGATGAQTATMSAAMRNIGYTVAYG